MQEVDQHETNTQLSERTKRQKKLYFTTKRVRERASSMRKNLTLIVVQKYTNDLAEIPDCIELNGLNEESEEARNETEVRVDDDEEENVYIKIYRKYENNSPHEKRRR